MPSKKKKYNSRFPPARIKKIMQTDDDVGKVAAAVPVIISRALELFIESLILKTNETTVARNAKTLTTSHIKQTIHGEKKFDFLRELVSTIPDHQTEDDGSENSGLGEPKKRGPRGPRKPKDGTNTRKRKDRKSSSESSEANANDDEETETDEEDNNGTTPTYASPEMAAPSTSHQLTSPSSSAYSLTPHIPHAAAAHSLPPPMPFNCLPCPTPLLSQVPCMPMPSVSGLSGAHHQNVVEDDDYDT